MNIKSLFPVFSHHPELIFLDSGASVQKPKYVLDAVRNFSEKNYANIHRGAYELSFEASAQFEQARKKIAEFLGSTQKNLILSKNGTEASNMIAHILEELYIKKGDEILISISEHHSNILPLKRIAEKKGAKIIWVTPENFEQGITPHDFEQKITEKTKIIAFAHISNVTGQIFPVSEISALAKKNNIITVLDACQSVPHLKFHFQEMGVDFAFFTGHKLGAGATGGFLFSDTQGQYIQEKQVSPCIVGGGIVEDVTETQTSFRKFPENFEAGTPNIEAVVGLGAAVDFLATQPYEQHGKEIVAYALEQFQKNLPHWKIVGPTDATIRSANISFYHENIHHLDISAYLSEKNIAVRGGFHCANPLHHFLKISGTTRASFWIYTEKADIDALISALREVEEILG